ncbi:centrosomal protein 295 [Cricetulus griseus]
MAEVTRTWRWSSRRGPNGCWVAGRLWTPVCREVQLHTLPDPLNLKYTEMKRKVMNTGKLRLSPNEEAFILKEDYERRRKLRLLQVREQEKGIAFQKREDIKQRKSQQFSRLAEELKAEWEKAQIQKIQNLEKLYLASLRHMGEGHRQAKENEPDLDALAQRTAERKRKAEMRHKEALKVQKNQKEMLMKQKTRHIKTRKEALLVEKERSAKVARLPPPVPAPFENIEINRIPSLKTNSCTYHHISTFVNRQMGTKQPDAHLAAEEEARRLEGLRKQAAQERREQLERAHARGSQAMKKIHLTQTQERLLEELKQLQKEDLARRRQTVAQMPPQLVELPYRRGEVKEDWHRELEFAFEDMYNADRKVKGNLILHLKPEPFPAMSDQLRDEELDLSMELENRAVVAFPPITDVAQSSVLLHPQEEAVRIRVSARHKQIMEIEKQKKKQLELLEQIEQQKLRLETDCFRAEMEEEEERKKTQQFEQDNMSLQKQLNLQREALHFRQRAQEELLVQRQTALQQQIEKHRETVKDFLNVSQARMSTGENDLKMQGPAWGNSDQESSTGERLGKELSGRASKPPVSKVKCGLDLNQHELSTIQEVESPASGRTSMPGKSDFYQDRDPLRVSVSREQSFLGSPLARDPFGCHQPPAQNSSSHDYDEAVEVEESDVEDHAILSHAVSEACTSLGPIVKPDDKAETQEISQEPLSSVTVSTGSLSYEITDLSLTDPVPAVDLDFPELEHVFPHLHRQLFKPLEPYLDFDLSLSSGISQDNRDFYESSESPSRKHHVKAFPVSTASFTELKASLQPAGNPAQSFAAEGSEQSFQQLLPEFSSQESQHADLPSIYSIEARGTSQSMENSSYSEQTETLQSKKKSVHFQSSTENLSSVYNSSDQPQLPHSIPCGSTSSECSVKPLGSRKEMLGFEELSRKVVTGSQSQRLAEDENVEETNSVQGSHSLSIENEKSVQDIIKTETTKVVRQLSQLPQAQHIMNSKSFSFQSSIPVWETESGYGIMEEPDLTLSTSDISTTETDLANLTLEEKDSEAQSSFQKLRAKNTR